MLRSGPAPAIVCCRTRHKHRFGDAPQRRDTYIDTAVQHTMADIAGPKIGDARSLWNFTPSPGWTREEAHALRLCLQKFGVGKWVQIVDSGVLPGKQIQQLNGQTQRLLGQQSLAEFTGMRVDIDAIRADNDAKQGPDIYRKAGLITNTGGRLGKDALKALREANLKKYGLSQVQIDAIELPQAPRAMKLGADAYMGKNHNKGGIAGVKRSIKRKREADVLTVDVDALPRPVKLLLLAALRKRLIQLRDADAVTGGVEASPPAAAADDAAEEKKKRVLKEKQNAATEESEGGAAKVANKKGGATTAGTGKKSTSSAEKKRSPKAPAAAKKGRSGGGKMEEENAAPPAAKSRRASAGVDNDAVQQLVAMGFSARHAKEAVLETGGDVMESVNWLVANCA